MLIAALFILVKMWQQLKYPLMDESIKKIWHTHAMDYYSPIKKGHSAIYENMDEPGVHYINEISQSQRDKYCVIPLI